VIKMIINFAQTIARRELEDQVSRLTGERRAAASEDLKKATASSAGVVSAAAAAAVMRLKRRPQNAVRP
jgi:hypothetical protein